MNNCIIHNNLNKLRDLLIEIQFQFNDIKHYIPSVWVNYQNNIDQIPINFPQFLVNKIDEILLISKELDFKKQPKMRIFNSFVRLTTAFDHINLPFITTQNLRYFKNEGTFIKTIALLPYLKELGITHLYLLPITEIGIEGRKGKLGSPYSIKNHRKIDEHLAEPLIDMSVEEQLAALVEACHLIGIKVVLEMVFRTSSKDNDLILDHPNWFYWVKSNNIQHSFKPPKFEGDDLKIIKEKIESKDFEDLIPPHADYINLFCDTPIKVWKEGNKIYGLTQKNELCEIPGAFADWPPDDTQPLWTDVTYLKLHTHPKFNYIAYNTVRMYDFELLEEQYRNVELWNYLIGIIPYYIKEFDIDGVMIDMGHALPNELLEQIVTNAKKVKENFLFIEENFVISNLSIDKGFEIVVGYLPFDLTSLDKTIHLINELSDPNLKIKFFGTPETHNTPRSYWRTKTKNYSVFTYLLSNLLSNSVPCIHNGFELLEFVPVNTGLDFSEMDIQQFPILPLFDYSILSWMNPKGNIIEEIVEINKIIDLHNFNIIQAQKTCENILSIQISDNQKNYILLVNYSNSSQKISLRSIDFLIKEIIFSSDVELSNIEILFSSSFAFVFGVLDK